MQRLLRDRLRHFFGLFVHCLSTPLYTRFWVPELPEPQQCKNSVLCALECGEDFCEISCGPISPENDRKSIGAKSRQIFPMFSPVSAEHFCLNFGISLSRIMHAVPLHPPVLKLARATSLRELESYGNNKTLRRVIRNACFFFQKKRQETVQIAK